MLCIAFCDCSQTLLNVSLFRVLHFLRRTKVSHHRVLYFLHTLPMCKSGCVSESHTFYLVGLCGSCTQFTTFILVRMLNLSYFCLYFLLCISLLI